ncbi:MAG: hypothetical protein CSA65_08850 [Proteobacteria bacterium]|nr:MAG: hypothetical protein CSB49_07395 [Pseudomonadota bacterium]PIE17479.1 MAG: hypothetical protein CSA65_08850 [Pseudomonadota bacterium]
MKSKQRKPSMAPSDPSQNDARYEELLSKFHELKMVCEVWVAANDAKDQRIQELETELEQAQQRIVRLSRRVGRPRGNEPAVRGRRITEAR